MLRASLDLNINAAMGGPQTSNEAAATHQDEESQGKVTRALQSFTQLLTHD
jgi:hypothetical protein